MKEIETILHHTVFTFRVDHACVQEEKRVQESVDSRKKRKKERKKERTSRTSTVTTKCLRLNSSWCAVVSREQKRVFQLSFELTVVDVLTQDGPVINERITVWLTNTWPRWATYDMKKSDNMIRGVHPRFDLRPFVGQFLAHFGSEVREASCRPRPSPLAHHVCKQ